jgi:integrase
MPKQVSLTDKQVKAINKTGRHCVDTASSLYLRLTPKGHKTYEVRVTDSRGKRIWRRVGDAEVMTLRAAKVAADTTISKAVEVKARTVAEAAAEYIQHNEPRWGSKNHRQWEQNFSDYINPAIGHLSCDQVTPNQVADILRPLQLEKPETARRTRSRISAVIRYELARNGVLGVDPAAQEVMALLLPKKKREIKHFAAPTLPQLRAILRYLRHGYSSHLALQWLIFTASRTSEVTGARWEEIDLDTNTWTVPIERSKTNVAYRVPITSAMRRVLERVCTTEGLLFPVKENNLLDINAMRQVVRKQGEQWTPHGVRSTFRVWAAENEYGDQIAEHQLGHVPRSQVVRAYQRSDLFEQRLRMMENWATAMQEVK